MRIGALIITTGLPRVSGVAALTPEVGAISAGQRMISAFQCAGVSLVGLVVGPEDKKAERQFAQNGVVFLRCNDAKAVFFQGIQHGLSFMQGKFDRVFLVPGDMPLFLPNTLEALLSSTAHIVIPENKYVNGYPVLLDHQAVGLILAEEDFKAAEKAVRKCNLSLESISVEDSGVLIRGEDMTHRKLLIQHHNNQLARPMTEVTLCNGGPLYDSRLSMLLHLVEDTRSVRDACSLMQISYSAAWNMLNHVEDELGYPLVTRIRGGATGSRSILTEKGRALMDAYDQYAETINQTAQALYRQVFCELLERN